MTGIVVEWEIMEGRSALISVSPGMPASEADKAADQLAESLTPEGARIVPGSVRWYAAT